MSSMTSLSALRSAALFWILYLAVLALLGALKAMLPAGSWRELAWGASSAMILLLLTRLFERRSRGGIERSTVSVDRDTPLRFLIGLAIGVSIVVINLAVVRAIVGPIRISTNDAVSVSGVTILMSLTFLALSAMEELGFRGYPLRRLTGAVGHWRAQAIVAAAFGLSHLAYGWSVSAVALGVIPTAILFGVAASVSGGLAMPIGIHAAVNLALWAVGSKGATGVWSITVPADAEARLASLSPLLGIPTVLVITAIIWRLRKPPPRDTPR